MEAGAAGRVLRHRGVRGEGVGDDRRHRRARRRRTLPHQVGILDIRAKGPQRVGVRRRAVVIQVQVLPVGVDARVGGAGGLPEFVGPLGHAGLGRVAFAQLTDDARGVPVPVAVGDRALRAAHQAANLRRSGVGGGSNRRRGVAGYDGSGQAAGNIVVAHQSAGHRLAGYLAVGVAGDDPPGIDARQHAGVVAAAGGGNLALRVHADDVAAVAARQRPDILDARSAGYVGVQQSQPAQCARGRCEQAQIPGGAADEEVADGVPVPVEERRERRVTRADGRPAAAAVPVGVLGIGLAAAVGVEVQVCSQFVAVAGRDVAAHVALGVGEGAGVNATGGAGVIGPVLPRHRAVAVQVPPHGVEPVEAVHVDQAVVVLVVVILEGRGLYRIDVLPRQVGVLALGAEGPQRVGVRRGAVAVQVQVIPVGVDARVPGGRLEVGGTLDHAGLGRVDFAQLAAEAGCVRVPVAVGDRAILRIAHHPADVRLITLINAREVGADPRRRITGDDASPTNEFIVAIAANQPAGMMVRGDLAGSVTGDDPAIVAGHQHATSV